MNRYLLFAGDSYYARGGFHDFRGSFPSLDDAMMEAKRESSEQPVHDWWHIYDTLTRKCIAASIRQAYNAPRNAPVC